MINEVRYDIHHLDLMDLAEGQESIKALKENTAYFQDAYTILIDGIPVFCIGAYMLTEQTANVWLVKSKYVETYKIEVIKTVKMLIENYFKMYNLKRMQTLIINERFKDWIEFLGFELESELVGYGEGKTYMYRRLK